MQSGSQQGDEERMIGEDVLL